MQSFYNGLSGMFNFSKSLDNVSNNISNLNTPGFKGNDVFVRSLSNGDNNYGSQINSTSIRSQEGDLRQTGNDTDLAISGNGYFVLQNKDGEMFYTRAGQFRFNENNQLIDSATEYNVMAVDANGALRKLDITEDRLLPPEATANVKLIGNLDPNKTTPSEINDLGVYDAKGERNALKLQFTKVAAPAVNTWSVVVKNSTDVTLATFQIQFGADSTPLAASSKVTQSLTLGGVAQSVIFDFGNPGSLAGATQLTGASSGITATAQDGHAALGLRSVTFNEDGVVDYKYTNGDNKKGQQVALALFNDPSTLQATTKGLLTTQSTSKPVIGKPNQKLYGTIKAKTVEMSNVDLTQEFADILIIQRGYQASSRVMSVSNDMLEQLYNNTRSR
jgi:flagellar hook protein FlgE